MLLIGNNYLYQANFPRSQRNKLSRVYYTVYDNTGAIHTPETQSGVVEFSNGSYGVMLGFPVAGSWSLQWRIDESPYVAGEEINIYNDHEIFTTIPY